LEKPVANDGLFFCHNSAFAINSSGFPASLIHLSSKFCNIKKDKHFYKPSGFVVKIFYGFPIPRELLHSLLQASCVIFPAVITKTCTGFANPQQNIRLQS